MKLLFKPPKFVLSASMLLKMSLSSLLDTINNIIDLIILFLLCTITWFLVFSILVSPLYPIIVTLAIITIPTSYYGIGGIVYFFLSTCFSMTFPVYITKLFVGSILIFQNELHRSYSPGSPNMNNLSKFLFFVSSIFRVYFMTMTESEFLDYVDGICVKAVFSAEHFIAKYNPLKMRFLLLITFTYFVIKYWIKFIGKFLSIAAISCVLILFSPSLAWNIFILPNRLWKIIYLDNVHIIKSMGLFKFLILLTISVRSVIMVWMLNATILLADFHFIINKYDSGKTRPLTNKTTRFRGVMNDVLQNISIVIDTIGLPNYIRQLPGKFDQKAISDTYAIASDLGWPVNVKLAEPTLGIAQGKYDLDWLVTGTDFKQGILNRRTYVDNKLQELLVDFPQFKRTESYATFDNELESTARYFKNPDVNFPDFGVGLYWPVLKDIFGNSMLTPFNRIIHHWEKRYALGAFFRDRLHPNRKFRRSKFITELGGIKAFNQLWARTFYYAPSLVPVSAVFIKGEALPEKKWKNDKVRTVIGSPIFQYIMSTIWNFEPNHRFRWETTPIKVGMPLNGACLGALWSRHSRMDYHYAGDMTAFDSTITGNVQQVIKAVRKKGFENHKDFDRISKLIDINYELVEKQLLNVTSTGNIYSKGSGLTTGHSSTSTDNSIVTTVLYLAAWRSITGYSAEEFKYYNELSCYGDDHVLSFTKTSPPSWTWNNIVKVFKEWNIEMRCEASGALHKIPFLSKFGRRPTPFDIKEMQRAGLPIPDFIVYHDRARLLGKLAAPVLHNSGVYRVKRLISFLDLCAHHPDVYEIIIKAIGHTKTTSRGVDMSKMTVPSYKKVLTNWYTKFSTPPPRDQKIEEFEHVKEEKQFVLYGQASSLDVLANFVASIPDVLNPIVIQNGYFQVIQKSIGHLLTWPAELICMNNNITQEAHLHSVMSRTSYNFLSLKTGIPSQQNSFSSLIIRHWLFLLFRSSRTFLPGAAFLTAFAKKFANLHFILNAKVQTEIKHNDLPLWNTFLIFALSHIKIPPLIDNIRHISLPNIDLFVDKVIGYVLVNFLYYVPPNYKDISHIMTLIEPGKPILISAPTGTGKSTTMVSFISKIMKTHFSKLIVIQPRSLLVKTLVPYLCDSVATDASGLTTGMSLDQRSLVWVMTAQEYLLHREFWAQEYLVIVDEAHIQEIPYLLLQKVLLQFKINYINVTATPHAALIESCSVHLKLRMASFYNILSKKKSFLWNSNQNFYKSFSNTINSILVPGLASTRYLIFVPDTKLGLKMVDECPLKATLLSSGNTNVDPEAQVIYTTSVCDAGITIPSVDVVITLDIDRRVGVLPNEQNLSPFFIRLSEYQLNQRKGRTGRTNNGVFYVINVPQNDTLKIIEDYKPTLNDSIGELLSMGLTGHDLATVIPEILLDFLNVKKGELDYGTEFDRKQIDPLLDQFATSIDSFILNLSPTLAYSKIQESLITNDGSDPVSIQFRARGRAYQPKQNKTSVMFVDMLAGAASLVNDLFPGISNFKDKNDIREKLWDYVNTSYSFSKFYAEVAPERVVFNDYSPDADIKSAAKAYQTEFWLERSDIWADPVFP